MGAATGYQSLYGYQLYDVTGATEDWNYVAQGAFGYTIELGPAEASADAFQGPYQTHVVQQYLGDGAPGGGKGVREALLLAGEQAADPRDHGVLDGDRAAPGATLRAAQGLHDRDRPVARRRYARGSGDCPRSPRAGALADDLDPELTVPRRRALRVARRPVDAAVRAQARADRDVDVTCEDAGGAVLAPSARS